MGVSIYVMPLRTYLGGNFRTTWDIKAEIMGRPGSIVSPEGIQDPPRPEKMSEVDVDVALETFRSNLESLGIDYAPADEDGPVHQAVAMSYNSFGRPCQRAMQWAYRKTFHRLVAMVPPQLWIPAPFESIPQVTAPWDPDSEVPVLSSQGISSELEQLLRLLEGEPMMEELQDLPEGAILTGALAEFYQEMEIARRLNAIATLSLEHRVPVIVEG